MARFIVVPQWQGSPSTRAMALIDGADAIAGDLPSSACTRVEVPLEAGEALGTGVHRASSLQRVQQSVAEAMAEGEGTPIVVGGDASVSIPAVGALNDADDLAVVWFSAQGGTHSPETSPDGALAGMAVRAIVGGFDGSLALSDDRSVPADRIAVIDARDADDSEHEFLTESGLVRAVSDDLTADPAAIVESLPTDARRVFVHIDLDVLDPAEIVGVSSPVPFGLTSQTLIDAIARIRSRFDLAGAAITGFSPSSPSAAVEDMGTILRIIGALAK